MSEVCYKARKCYCVFIKDFITYMGGLINYKVINLN